MTVLACAPPLPLADVSITSDASVADDVLAAPLVGACISQIAIEAPSALLRSVVLPALAALLREHFGLRVRLGRPEREPVGEACWRIGRREELPAQAKARVLGPIAYGVFASRARCCDQVLLSSDLLPLLGRVRGGVMALPYSLVPDCECAAFLAGEGAGYALLPWHVGATCAALESLPGAVTAVEEMWLWDALPGAKSTRETELFEQFRLLVADHLHCKQIGHLSGA